MSQSRTLEEKPPLLGEELVKTLIDNVSNDISRMVDEAYYEHVRRILNVDKPRIFSQAKSKIHQGFKSLSNQILFTTTNIFENSFKYFLGDFIESLLRANQELSEQTRVLSGDNERMIAELKTFSLNNSPIISSNAQREFANCIDDFVTEINRKVVSHLKNQIATCSQMISQCLSQEPYILEMKGDPRSAFIVKRLNSELSSLLTHFQSVFLNEFRNWYYETKSDEFRNLVGTLAKDNISIRELLNMKGLMRVKESFKEVLPLVEDDVTLKSLLNLYAQKKDKFEALQKHNDILKKEMNTKKAVSYSSTLFAVRTNDNPDNVIEDKAEHLKKNS